MAICCRILKLAEKNYPEKLNTTNQWQGVGKNAKGSVFLVLIQPTVNQYAGIVERKAIP